MGVFSFILLFSIGLMEKMENEYSTLFSDVSPSVVLVKEVGRVNNYCIGSVILSEGESTFILTQSNIAKASANLSVCFSNGFEQPATVLSSRGYFCVLVTKFYLKAKEVQFFEGAVDFSYAATIAPASKSSVHRMPGFIIQRSLRSGSRRDETVYPDSEDYFVFMCRYGDKSPDRVSRLLSGPVFHLDTRAIGVVVSDMEYEAYPHKADAQHYHSGFSVKMGYFLKVVMRVSKLQEEMRLMAKHDNWRNGLKQIALEVKGAP